MEPYFYIIQRDLENIGYFPVFKSLEFTDRIPCYTSAAAEVRTWPVPKEVDVSASVADENIL